MIVNLTKPYYYTLKDLDTRTVVNALLPKLEAYAVRLNELYNPGKKNASMLIYQSDDFILHVYFDKLQGGQSRLEFSSGTFCILYEYVKLFLSDSDIFKGVGNSSNITSFHSLNIKDYKICNIPSFSKIDSSVQSKDPVLFDNERVELIDFLFAMIARFLIAHEMFHIFDGHTEFITELFLEAQLRGDKDFKLDPLISQTIEWDADNVAVHIAYLWIVNVFPKSTQGKRGHSFGIYCLSFSLNLLFALFLNSTALLSEENTHPRSTIRLLCISETLAQKRYNSDEIQMHVKAASDFWLTVDRIFQIYDMSEYKEMNEQFLVSTNRKYSQEWRRLRPLLQNTLQ